MIILKKITLYSDLLVKFFIYDNNKRDKILNLKSKEKTLELIKNLPLKLIFIYDIKQDLYENKLIKNEIKVSKSFQNCIIEMPNKKLLSFDTFKSLFYTNDNYTDKIYLPHISADSIDNKTSKNNTSKNKIDLKKIYKMNDKNYSNYPFSQMRYIINDENKYSNEFSNITIIVILR